MDDCRRSDTNSAQLLWPSEGSYSYTISCGVRSATSAPRHSTTGRVESCVTDGSITCEEFLTELFDSVAEDCAHLHICIYAGRQEGRKEGREHIHYTQSSSPLSPSGARLQTYCAGKWLFEHPTAALLGVQLDIVYQLSPGKACLNRRDIRCAESQG